MCEASACLLSPVLFYTSHYGLSIAAGTMQHWWRLEGFVGCDLLISALTHTHTQIYSVWMYLACCPFVGRDHLYSLSHTQRIISPTLSKFDTVNASNFIGAAVSHLFPPSPVFFTVFYDAGIQNWLLCLNSTKGVEIFDIILLFVLKLFQFKDNLNPFPLPCWCTALLARSRKLHLVPMLSFN